MGSTFIFVNYSMYFHNDIFVTKIISMMFAFKV